MTKLAATSTAAAASSAFSGSFPTCIAGGDVDVHVGGCERVRLPGSKTKTAKAAAPASSFFSLFGFGSSDKKAKAAKAEGAGSDKSTEGADAKGDGAATKEAPKEAPPTDDAVTAWAQEGYRAWAQVAAARAAATKALDVALESAAIAQGAAQDAERFQADATEAAAETVAKTLGIDTTPPEEGNENIMELGEASTGQENLITPSETYLDIPSDASAIPSLDALTTESKVAAPMLLFTPPSSFGPRSLNASATARGVNLQRKKRQWRLPGHKAAAWEEFLSLGKCPHPTSEFQ